MRMVRRWGVVGGLEGAGGAGVGGAGGGVGGGGGVGVGGGGGWGGGVGGGGWGGGWGGGIGHEEAGFAGVHVEDVDAVGCGVDHRLVIGGVGVDVEVEAAGVG